MSLFRRVLSKVSRETITDSNGIHTRNYSSNPSAAIPNAQVPHGLHARIRSLFFNEPLRPEGTGFVSVLVESSHRPSLSHSSHSSKLLSVAKAPWNLLQKTLAIFKFDPSAHVIHRSAELESAGELSWTALRRYSQAEQQQARREGASSGGSGSGGGGGGGGGGKRDQDENEAGKSTAQRVYLQYHHLEEALRIRGYNTLRIILLILAAGGIVFYTFQDQIYQMVGQRSAEVATITLSDQTVRDQAALLSSSILEQLLTDPRTTTEVIRFLRGLAANRDTQLLLADLFKQVLQTEDVTQQAQELVVTILNMPVIQMEVRRFAISQVHAILDDESVQEHAKRFVQSVVSDEKVQHDTGAGLWNAMVAAITPRFLSSDGGSTAAHNNSNNNNSSSKK